jgi:hypothetical protein
MFNLISSMISMKREQMKELMAHLNLLKSRFSSPTILGEETIQRVV